MEQQKILTPQFLSTFIVQTFKKLDNHYYVVTIYKYLLRDYSHRVFIIPLHKLVTNQQQHLY